MTYDFSGAFDEEPKATPTLAPVVPIAPVKSKYDFGGAFDTPSPEEATLHSALFDAAFVNPDDAAKRIKLAREMDSRPGILPPLPDAEAMAWIKRHPADSILKDAPALGKWLQEEDNAKIAKDDINVLSEIGRILGNFGRSAAASVPATSGALWGGLRAAGDVLGLATKPVADFTGLPLDLGGSIAELGKSGQEAAKRTEQRIEGAQEGAGFTEKAIYSGAKSLGQNLQLLPLTIASGSPSLMLGGMGAITGGQAYGEARDQGVGVGQSLVFAGSQGVIEIATEKLPVGVLLRDLGLNRSFGRVLVNQLFHENVGEQVATALQDLNEWAVLHPEKTFRDYLNERPDAALQTLISTVVASGGMAIGGKAIDRAANGQQRAQQEALFKALGDSAQASKLRERMPDKFKELLDRYTQDGPVKDVFIDAEHFNQYFQGMALDPAVVANQLGVTDWQEATLRNGNIAIPISQFATQIAPTEHLAGLMQDVKLDPAELSAREAKLAEANRGEADKQAQQNIDSIMAEGKADASLSAQIKAIVDDVAGQLSTRYDPQTANSMATLLRGVAVLSQREAIERAKVEGREATPEEIQALTQATWAKYGLSIRANPNLPDILRQKPDLEAAIDPLLDRIRTGDTPTDTDLFGFSLSEFISQKGGLQDLGGELSARDADAGRKAFQKKLVQKDGLTYNAARELALEAGFPVGDTEASFLDAIDKELRGQPVYALGKENSEAMRLRDELGALSEALQAVGIDLKTADNAAAKAALFPQGQELLQESSASAAGKPKPAWRTAEKVSNDSILSANAYGLREHARGEISGAAWYSPAHEAAYQYGIEGVDLSTQPVVTGWRRGKARWGGESFNYRDGVRERGLSMMSVDGSEPGFSDMFMEGREKHEYTGILLPDKGSDGEPLILPFGDENVDRDENEQGSASPNILYQSDAFVERRKAPRLRTEDLEKPLEDMTPAELIEAITRLRQHTNTNPLTGLPSKAVWEAKQAEGKLKAFVASIDADGLKWFNDAIGHEPGGNVLLNRIGAALLDAGVDAYHISGDEFYATADSAEELEKALIAAQNELSKTVISGNGWTVTGAGFSFGIATDMKEAEDGLHKQKTEREAAGLRKPRGEPPSGAVRTDRGNDGRAVENDAAAAARDQSGTGQGVRLFQVVQPPDRRFKIGDLPRDMREELFNEHAMNLNPDATERQFYAKRVPSGLIDIKDLQVEDIPSAQLQRYRDAKLEDLPPIVIADGRLIDGQHRIQAAREKGIRQLRYIDMTGLIDTEAGGFISELPESFSQSGDKNRGSILIGDDRKMRIELLEDANLSTFLHETGHFYLEVLGDMAEAPGASQRIRDDYASILKWMGVDSRAKIEVKHHEMFARANEAYLMEGKAPSVELRGTFARFKAWMTLIYRQLSSLNVKLSDEVRGVFNRIYATDAEIAAAAAQNDFLDLFANAKAMGVSQAEFNVYVSQAASAIEQGNDRLRAKMMRVQKLRREAWWKDETKRVQAEVAAELDARPDYRAHAALTPSDSELKLDRRDLVRRYGAAILKRLPRGYGPGQGAVYTGDGVQGVSVDSAAELLNFESGDALVEALANLRNRNRLIVAEADARMSERHGDLLNSVEAADEAQAALHNSERARKLAMEMRALRKLQGQAERIAKVRERDQANTEAIGRDVANDLPPLDVFREAAKRAIAGKKIRDLRPNDYLLAERKANKKAFEALGKKDYAAAQQAKQQELLNFELYREATRAREEVDKLRAYAKTFEKASKREKLGKAGEQYLEAADTLLQDLDLAQKSLKAIDREKIQRWLSLQEQQDLYFTPEMAAGEFAKNWQELTVEEMRAVGDALRNLEHVATKQNLVMDGQKEVDLDAAVEEMRTSAEAANKLQPQEISNAHRSWAGKKVDAFQDWMGDLLNVRTMAGWLDGGKVDGPWHRLLINRASAAQIEQFRLTRDVLMPVNSMIEEYLDGPGKHLEDEFSTRFGKMTRHHILSVAFNLGNASNKDKLIRGGLPKWQDGTATKWTETDIANLVAKLDAADWVFVQGVWDLLDKQMYPAINALEKRINGVPLKKVDAVSFEVSTADGETFMMRGGYFPMSYDPRFSNAGQKQETGPLAGLVEGGFAYVTTPKGQTKARVEGFAAPANLDFAEVLGRHLSQSILDLSHREFFLDAQKLLKQNRVRQTLQQRLGEKYEKEFNNWLKRIANHGSNTPTGALSSTGRFFEKARTNTTILFLGFKVSTILSQFAGLSNSVEAVGPGWMWRGTQEAFTSPAKSMKFVMEKSPRMQQRWNTLDTTIYEAFGRLHKSKLERAKDSINRAAFAGIAIADRLVSTPTWLAAYRKALAEGVSEENAIHAGDDAVIASQGDGASMELNKIQGERGFARLFTVFYTPFAAQFNRLYTAGRKAQGGLKYTPEFVMRAMLLTAIPAIIADLLTNRGPKTCEIDDVQCNAKWAGVKAISSLAATMPFVRETGQAFEGWATGNKKPDLKYSPVFSASERAYDAAKKAIEAMAEGHLDNDTFFKALESSGYFLGLPTAQVGITGNYLYDLLSGEDDGEHWYRDLLFRRAK